MPNTVNTVADRRAERFIDNLSFTHSAQTKQSPPAVLSPESSARIKENHRSKIDIAGVRYFHDQT
jgi:hypothetical protein